MFPNGYFPRSHFPDGYFPKPAVGAAAAVTAPPAGAGAPWQRQMARALLAQQMENSLLARMASDNAEAVFSKLALRIALQRLDFESALRRQHRDALVNALILAEV